MKPEEETTPNSVTFDFSAYPPNTCFHERRTGRNAPAGQDSPRGDGPAAPVRRRKERRRRVDPTTFEKQYTPDEIEFMNAMQYFKVQSGKAFPTYREVLSVARKLGYCRPAPAPDADVRS